MHNENAEQTLHSKFGSDFQGITPRFTTRNRYGNDQQSKPNKLELANPLGFCFFQLQHCNKWGSRPRRHALVCNKSRGILMISYLLWLSPTSYYHVHMNINFMLNIYLLLSCQIHVRTQRNTITYMYNHLAVSRYFENSSAPSVRS